MADVRTLAQQKAALTRALKAPENKRRERVIRECQRVKVEWFAAYGVHSYPDDWSRWQRALTDVGVYDDIEEV